MSTDKDQIELSTRPDRTNVLLHNLLNRINQIMVSGVYLSPSIENHICHLMGINHVTAKAEIGIAIMDRKYRSGGYGTEALTLSADYAFNTLNLYSLGLTVFPSNSRAIRAYKKVGFKEVDILKDSWTMPSGEQVDMLLMELNKDGCRSMG